jgi:DNA invertase Pin-like site-specific DNA recombinase
MITKNPEWSFAGIYADEGISGAHADNRPDFMRLIKDCMEGKIDVIMIKSVSRMGRNTLDNIKYIKMLKEKGISIRFEEEHCDSLSEMGDFMLTLMSSMAQQELINTSQHTRKGLKMKMGR